MTGLWVVLVVAVVIGCAIWIVRQTRAQIDRVDPRLTHIADQVRVLQGENLTALLDRAIAARMQAYRSGGGRERLRARLEARRREREKSSSAGEAGAGQSGTGRGAHTAR